MANFKLQLFAGTSHPALARAIAEKIGVKLSKIVIERFACGEIYARPEDTVRGNDVFVIQTGGLSINEELIELFVILDAMKRSFAQRVHVVMPHYPYARQDRVAMPREPISAKLLADLLSAAGSDHVITVDLHSAQTQGFFNYPADNLTVTKLFIDYFRKKKIKDLMIVAPDVGAARQAKKLAIALDADLAILYKTRPQKNVAQIMNVVGDVKGKTCVLYDDMIDTGGTVISGKEALIRAGANRDVYLAAAHAVFSKDAPARLRKAGFREVVVTDSVPIPKEKQFSALRIITIAPLLADVIRHVHEAKSVTQIL